MGRYLGGRLVYGLVTLFLFVTLLFFGVNLLVPGDFVNQFILTGSDAQAIREALGLDRPLWDQYLSWLTGLLRFDLGQSFEGVDVSLALANALPSTMLVLAVGLTIAFVLGGWLGRVSAYGERSSYFSGSITFVAILFLTLFPPVLAVLMERGLHRVFGFSGLGTIGTIDHELWDWDGIAEGVALSPFQVLWRMIAVLGLTLVGLLIGERVFHRVTRKRIPRWAFLLLMVTIPLIAWRQMGLTDFAFDIVATLSLLLAGVVILTFGDVLLVTRAAMDDVMLEDYVMVARAKGLPEKEVRDRHAARTALLPVLSRFTVSIPYFLTGLVILEATFAGAGVAGVGFLQRVTAPEGLGSLLFGAVTDQDIPLIMGALLLIGVLTLVLRIGLDVAHALLDPRIRFGGSNGS